MKNELDVEADSIDALVEHMKEVAEEDFDGKPAITISVMASDDGHYRVMGSSFRVSRPTIYMLLGVLDQVKLDLLSSVPSNRPLREPEAEEEPDDEDISPIGSA